MERIETKLANEEELDMIGHRSSVLASSTLVVVCTDLLEYDMHQMMVRSI
jgi:hypothetical protein